MIRYHSFYPWHRERAYTYFESDADRQALKDVLAFNPYDLYSKSDSKSDPVALRAYYEGLIAKFFPEKINWEIENRSIQRDQLCRLRRVIVVVRRYV